MLMRYIGGAPGHITTTDASRALGRLSAAYAQEFADRRAQELAQLGYEDKNSKETEVIESRSEDEQSGPDAGADERSDDSDYFPEPGDNEDDDFAYGWEYPGEGDNVTLEDGVREDHEGGAELDEGEEMDDGETQALGYDVD